MSRPTIAPQSDFQCLVVEQALARSAPPGQTLDFCDASFSPRPPVLHDTSPLLCTADPLGGKKTRVANLASWSAMSPFRSLRFSGHSEPHPSPSNRAAD